MIKNDPAYRDWIENWRYRIRDGEMTRHQAIMAHKKKWGRKADLSWYDPVREQLGPGALFPIIEPGSGLFDPDWRFRQGYPPNCLGGYPCPGEDR